MELRRRKSPSFSRPYAAPSSSRSASKYPRVLSDPFSDAARKKRVKFTGEAIVLENMQALQNQKIQFLNCDPKTSEYKFFREMLQKNHETHQSFCFPMKTVHTSASPQKEVTRETNSLITSWHESGRDITPAAKVMLVSPSKVLEEYETSMNRSMLPILDVTPVMQRPFSPSNMSWTYEYGNGRIFLKKRSRLLELVESSCQGKGKIEFNRFHLISKLLQRLGIDKKSQFFYEGQREWTQNMFCDKVHSLVPLEPCFFGIKNKMVGSILYPSTTKKYLEKDLSFHHEWLWNYNKLGQPSNDTMDFLPIQNWLPLENGILENNQTSLELVKAENWEAGDYIISPPVIPCISTSEYNNHSSDFSDEISTRTECWNQLNELSCCSMEQSLIPYTKPKYFETRDLWNLMEQSDVPYLEWKERKSDYHVASESLASEEMDHFPLT
ncbi:uncharacterized protein LOC121992372 [Zingiber officinale]|uniref:uncharacterized protein LOC121992372 n=1 Tax=Zingiber officinale TaxID=94328 RepID=UPI001C4CB4AF|nr:uncharacterized protein LOC121992372 [Zingiber officinale]